MSKTAIRRLQPRSHTAGYGTAEMIYAGSQDPSSSGPADPRTEGCHGLGSKLPVKVGDHVMTIGTD